MSGEMTALSTFKLPTIAHQGRKRIYKTFMSRGSQAHLGRCTISKLKEPIKCSYAGLYILGKPRDEGLS